MPLALTVAISDYDHVRDLFSRVDAEGLQLRWLCLPVEDIFFRFTSFQEWEVSEMSLAKYVALRSRGDESMVAIPVFPSRVFRHSAIYVRSDSQLEHPRQLAGTRVGIPEWAQTAGVYVRGLLIDQYGVALRDVRWYQAGVNQPGRVEKVRLRLPEGVRVTPVPDRTLGEMLLAGDLDAVVTAHPPGSFERGEGLLRRLFRDAMAEEETYWRATGIFPIMHVVVIRGDVYRAHPWVAMSLYRAFDQARRRAVDRLFEITASRVPLPWGPDLAVRWRGLFGDEYWPYGLEPNRRTLDAFCRHAAEQGVCDRRLEPEELFPESVLTSYRV
jgi:4,5-dihydroxyphthalate decarboxylase